MHLQPLHGEGGRPDQEDDQARRPARPYTMVGPQGSTISSRRSLLFDIGRTRARVLTGGRPQSHEGALSGATTSSTTSSSGTTRCAFSRRRSSDRSSRSPSSRTMEEAHQYCQRHVLRPGPACSWSRRQRMLPVRTRRSRPVACWSDCYHAYPAHAAFGGYKHSGVGRENHKMMLDHYQQTKNLLVRAYSPKAARLLILMSPGPDQHERSQVHRCRFIPLRAGGWRSTLGGQPSGCPPFSHVGTSVTNLPPRVLTLTARRRVDRAAGRSPRTADVSPVGRLLRRVRPDVLHARRVSRGPGTGRAPWPAGRRHAGVDRRGAVSILASHADHPNQTLSRAGARE